MKAREGVNQVDLFSVPRTSLSLPYVYLTSSMRARVTSPRNNRFVITVLRDALYPTNDASRNSDRARLRFQKLARRSVSEMRERERRGRDTRGATRACERANEFPFRAGYSEIARCVALLQGVSSLKPAISVLGSPRQRRAPRCKGN